MRDKPEEVQYNLAAFLGVEEALLGDLEDQEEEQQQQHEVGCLAAVPKAAA